MAGFFFWHSSEQYNPDTIDDEYSSLGYIKGKHLNYGKWNVVIFSKSLYNIRNYHIYHDGIVCGVGTFAYREKMYDKALPLVYNDFNNSSLQKKTFWGSFIIIIINKNGLTIIRDGAGLTRLYKLLNRNVFSTSYAGLINTTNNILTLDKEATTELLMTGVLTGNRTIINNINRVGSSSDFEDINIIKSEPIDYPQPKNREEALNQQIEIAKEYYNRISKDWCNYMPEGVLDVGLTGGMDSRLNAALALNTNGNILFHTHWRKEGLKNDDYLYANILAEKTNKALNIKRVLSPFEMSGAELEENFHDAYCLSDGVIRPGCYWDEQYNTFYYRSGLTDKPYLRMLGFGGEQYRNGERLPLYSKRNIQSWVKWEMVYQFAGSQFTTKKAYKDTEKIIAYNLKMLLGEDSKLNLFNYKKYVRMVQSPSYRSLQASMENRVGFCLNPFLDTCLSFPSENAIPFLGKSLSFQLDMIKRISPEVAIVPNGYGFNFLKGEPIHLKIAAIAWQLMPPSIKYPLFLKIKNNYRSDFIPELVNKHAFVRDLEKNVLQLNLPVNFKKHRLIRSRARLMLNLGYFLKRNKEKIEY